MLLALRESPVRAISTAEENIMQHCVSPSSRALGCVEMLWQLAVPGRQAGGLSVECGYDVLVNRFGDGTILDALGHPFARLLLAVLCYDEERRLACQKPIEGRAAVAVFL